MSILHSFIKTVNPSRLVEDLANAGFATVAYVETVGDQVNIYFTEEVPSETLTLLETTVDEHQPQLTEELVSKRIDEAITFGMQLIRQYVVENVMLGITQANMTSTVRVRLAGITDALMTGSLYDALAAISAIPAEHKDGVFISNARLLTFGNKIRVHLGLTPL